MPQDSEIKEEWISLTILYECANIQKSQKIILGKMVCQTFGLDFNQKYDKSTKS